MDAICRVLGVEKEIFYPQSFTDWFESSEDFRNRFYRNMEKIEWKTVSESGISIFFWELLWNMIPYTELLFPLSEREQDEKLLFVRKVQAEICEIYREDLEFVKRLQDDVMEYISMALIKGVLSKRLAEAKAEAASNAYDETQTNLQLDRIISTMVLALGHAGNKEE